MKNLQLKNRTWIRDFFPNSVQFLKTEILKKVNNQKMEISFSYGLNSDMVKHMLIKYIFSISDFVLNEHTFYPDENEILKTEIF